VHQLTGWQNERYRIGKVAAWRATNCGDRVRKIESRLVLVTSGQFAMLLVTSASAVIAVG